MFKKYIVLIFIILLFQEVFAFSFPSFKSGNLYPINDDNGGGYIDNNGNIIVEQKYKFTFRFDGNYAIVQGENLKYGVIDKKGNIVIDFIYDDLNNLSENFVIYKENDKYGYIDILNNRKSDAIYDGMKQFKEGMAAVRIDEKWGFVNKKGELIIQPKYYSVANFSENLAAVSYKEHTTAGFINKKGRTVISFEDNALEPKEFSQGLVPIIKAKDKSCSYINKRGKIVIDREHISPLNVYCGNFSNNSVVFYIDDNPRKITTGYIDKKGNIKYAMTFSITADVSEGEFSAFDDFSSDMARFTIDYKTGYINNKFKLVIPPIYEFARNFEDDLAYVKFENKEGYINKKGLWVWSKNREGM